MLPMGDSEHDDGVEVVNLPDINSVVMAAYSSFRDLLPMLRHVGGCVIYRSISRCDVAFNVEGRRIWLMITLEHAPALATLFEEKATSNLRRRVKMIGGIIGLFVRLR